MLEASDLRDAIARLGQDIATLRDTLDAADRTMGDGDTGRTVASIVAAWGTALSTAPSHPDNLGTLLLELAAAASRASGSSLGSVVSIALRAAGRALPGQACLDRAGLVHALDAACSAITARSGASAGDKTILDALLAVRDALAASDDAADLQAVALHAAEQAVRQFRERECRVGRARIYGSRSIGHDDPGMLFAAMALRLAMPATPAATRPE